MTLSLKSSIKFLFSLSLIGLSSFSFADGWDPDSQASASGSIANTRHNLTLSYSSGFIGTMDQARNNYGEICIYCHTPHGANKQIAAPLWNRTINAGNYTIYDKETTLGLAGRLGLPGPGSLTCLSCHDGTIAIDSILNMPGSGGVGNDETGTANTTFLDTWNQPGLSVHARMGNAAGAGGSVETGTCSDPACHATKGGARADFRVFVLGTDLRDDHVVGIQFPTAFGAGIDFNEPDVTIPGKWAFFDTNGNNFADKNEVRLYDSGDGPEVECASCHDPHGIPSNGPGTRFNPSFLRINNGIGGASNAGTAGITSDGPSALCLTCHAK